MKSIQPHIAYLRLAKDLLGGGTELARRVAEQLENDTMHNVNNKFNNWIRRGKQDVPVDVAVAIEQATDGKVTAEQINPKIAKCLAR
jgi:DNA-binding transcriptional regulator YdaS (Cro superfamily)